MKLLRKRLTWILLTLFLLPVLIASVWYWRQARQQRLDCDLIAAIKGDREEEVLALLIRILKAAGGKQ